MPDVPAEVRAWLEENGYGRVTGGGRMAGGCISQGQSIHTTSEEKFFLKQNTTTPKDMFTKEALGLKALDVPDGPRVPKAYLAGGTFILLEDLNPQGRAGDYSEILGRQMAALHAHTNNQFGFETDNYIGSTEQINPWTPDGFEFFNQHRLRFQAMLAYKRGLLGKVDVDRTEALIKKLPDLIPPQPASLSHGDLWSGNAISDENGQPAIIDPAAHYGWAEADMAMTALFGGFDSRFYAAYEESAQPAPGWRSRFEIYNLYHLLNHLNLFGRGYLGRVQGILKRYGN